MRTVVVTLCLLVVGCSAPSTAEPTPGGLASPGGVSSAPSPTSGPTRQPTPAATPADQPAGTTIIAADSKFGSMLYDDSGQPIYLFDAETTSQPECDGKCADAWPPVLTEGTPRAKGAVRSDLLGTTRRKDGSVQITYAGHPLYFYAHEGKYQVLCHNVTEFGGTWLVVQPNGKPAAN
jgi:predicted lipoprotein with Yx(FWY)xxD motif